MRISVIIPAFNAADVLPAQLHALAGQVTGDDEVIVADNGSTDETASVVTAWMDRLPVTLVDASARRGQAAARNVAAATAKGDLLAFTDADDIVLPGWLESWADQGPSLALGGGPVIPFFPGEAPAADTRRAAHELPTAFGFLPYALGTNIAVRRSTFEAAGGFAAQWPPAEDIELSWRLQLGGNPITFVAGAVVAKRERDSARAVLHQYYRYGLTEPHLYREFRAHGLRRPSALATTTSYLGLVARLPLLWFPEVRTRWCRQAGRRAGRIAGSRNAHTLLL